MMACGLRLVYLRLKMFCAVHLPVKGSWRIDHDCTMSLRLQMQSRLLVVSNPNPVISPGCAICMAKVSSKVFDEVSTMKREAQVSFYLVSLTPRKKISALSPGVKHVARLVGLTDPKQGDRGATTTCRARPLQLGHCLCTPHPGPFKAYCRMSDPDTGAVLTDIHVPPLARILLSSAMARTRIFPG